MSEIDPDLSARWRAASDEKPPAALDDAIRAAARREVGAKPGGFRATPRWWPLAAAATVAVLAVGIIQMTPPEQVAPASFPPTTDTVRRDVKADADKRIENSQKPDAVAAAPPRLQSDMLREEVKPVAKEQRSRASDEKAPRAGARVGGFAAAPAAQFQEKKSMPPSPAQRIEDAPDRDHALKQKTELAAASSVARQNPNVASPPPASAPRNELQAFPAAPVPAEAVASNAPKPVEAAAPPPAPATTSPLPAVAARKLAAQSSETGASSDNRAGTSVGSIASNRGGSSARNDAGNAEPVPAKDAAALGKVTAAEADKAAPERRKDAAPLAPDEWIKRIRRLIAEGRNEDAARELTAFRREYKERSDSLLPSDLRTFRQ
jgi:hypothetical protein